MDWENRLLNIINRHNLDKSSWAAPFWETQEPVIDKEINPSTFEGIESGLQLTYVDPKDPSKKAFYVIVYIKYLKQFEGGWTPPKFHIARCSTIDGFINRKKFGERYFASRNKTDELEVVKSDNFNRQKTEKIRLYICKNCLKSINYMNYKYVTALEQEKIYSSFSITEYFSIFIDTSVPLPQKVKNWLNR